MPGGGTFTPARATDLSLSFATDVDAAAHGAVLYRGGDSRWHALAPGTLGQAVLSGGPGADVAWGSAGVTDHGALTGLADDDHAQYALADKSRPATWVSAADLSARSIADLGTRTHALLTSLSADDHAQYIFNAPASGTRNIIQPTGNFLALGVRGAVGQTNDIFEVQDSNGFGLLMSSPAALCQVRSPAGTLVGFQAADDSNNPRFFVNTNGTSFWAAVPSTAGVTSNNSPAVNLQSTRWTGSASAQENMGVICLRLDSGAGRVTMNFRDTAGATALAVAGLGGQVSVGYAFPSAANLASRGQFHVLSLAATTPAATFRGAASQSANLTEWQDSAGTVLARVTANGSLEVIRTSDSTVVSRVDASTVTLTVRNNLDVIASNGVTMLSSSSTSGRVQIRAKQADSLVLQILGAASQTGNLTEWLSNAGTVYGTISENGFWTTRKTSAPADAEIATGELALWFDSTAGAARLMVKAKDAGGTVRTASVALA